MKVAQKRLADQFPKRIFDISYLVALSTVWSRMVPYGSV